MPKTLSNSHHAQAGLTDIISLEGRVSEWIRRLIITTSSPLLRFNDSQADSACRHQGRGYSLVDETGTTGSFPPSWISRRGRTSCRPCIIDAKGRILAHSELSKKGSVPADKADTLAAQANDHLFKRRFSKGLPFSMPRSLLS